MKKLYIALVLILSVFLLSGCGSTANVPSTGTVKTAEKVPEILNQAGYLLYQNIFYNGYGTQYEGQEVVKRGVLAKLQDAYSQRNRYYVWGYLDNTKCCDWQWEIVPMDEKSLPPVGSLVMVKGVFRADDAALDGYWITDASVNEEIRYIGAQEEINMLAMDVTLERVQMYNILYRSSAFEGKLFTAQGRIAAPGVLEDPVYNGSWQIPFSSEAACPSIGTLVTLTGRISEGELRDCTMRINP